MTRTEEANFQMEAEYDFSKGRRRTAAERIKKGLNVAVIDPELYLHFPSSERVNEALRLLLKASTKAVKGKAARPAKAS